VTDAVDDVVCSSSSVDCVRNENWDGTGAMLIVVEAVEVIVEEAADAVDVLVDTAEDGNEIITEVVLLAPVVVLMAADVVVVELPAATEVVMVGVVTTSEVVVVPLVVCVMIEVVPLLAGAVTVPVDVDVGPVVVVTPVLVGEFVMVEAGPEAVGEADEVEAGPEAVGFADEVGPVPLTDGVDATEEEGAADEVGQRCRLRPFARSQTGPLEVVDGAAEEDGAALDVGGVVPVPVGEAADEDAGGALALEVPGGTLEVACAADDDDAGVDEGGQRSRLRPLRRSQTGLVEGVGAGVEDVGTALEVGALPVVGGALDAGAVVSVFVSAGVVAGADDGVGAGDDAGVDWGGQRLRWRPLTRSQTGLGEDVGAELEVGASPVADGVLDPGAAVPVSVAGEVVAAADDVEVADEADSVDAGEQRPSIRPQRRPGEDVGAGTDEVVLCGDGEGVGLVDASVPVGAEDDWVGSDEASDEDGVVLVAVVVTVLEREVESVPVLDASVAVVEVEVVTVSVGASGARS
jgi:hypothetical protein